MFNTQKKKHKWLINIWKKKKGNVPLIHSPGKFEFKLRWDPIPPLSEWLPSRHQQGVMVTPVTAAPERQENGCKFEASLETESDKLAGVIRHATLKPTNQITRAPPSSSQNKRQQMSMRMWDCRTAFPQKPKNWTASCSNSTDPRKIPRGL